MARFSRRRHIAVRNHGDNWYVSIIWNGTGLIVPVDEWGFLLFKQTEADIEFELPGNCVKPSAHEYLAIDLVVPQIGIGIPTRLEIESASFRPPIDHQIDIELEWYQRWPQHLLEDAPDKDEQWVYDIRVR